MLSLSGLNITEVASLSIIQSTLYSNESQQLHERWSDKKNSNMRLAEVYDKFDRKKAERLRSCARMLVFGRTERGLALVNGNFCRVGLCPMCQWRRARKLQGQMARILHHLEPRGYKYIFVTLTVRNCGAAELSGTLDKLAEGWRRLSQYKAVKSIAKGAYRGLEITHDCSEIITPEMYVARRLYYIGQGLHVGDLNPNYNTYHPHYHCLIAVKPSYFTGRLYLSQEKWRELWRRALGVDYLPSVNVRRVKGRGMEGVIEACKYTVKESDFLTDDIQFDTQTVRALDTALHKRRLSGLSGDFRDAHKMLNLSDTDDPAPDTDDSMACERVSFVWVTGVRAYRAVK